MNHLQSASRQRATTPHSVAEGDSQSLPKAPVLGWPGLLQRGRSGLPSVGDTQHSRYTTSGRAALYAALKQLQLPQGSAVLVPTYHCPTMVAPIVEAGLLPAFYGLTSEGLPQLDAIDTPAGQSARAMFVAHYFGLTHSLQAVLDWCEERGIVLIEDCAHSYFGMAGERPVGQWGHYATASLSKFFPVREAGLLVSHSKPLEPLDLAPIGARDQLRALWDVLDMSQRHDRLSGAAGLVRLLRKLRPSSRLHEAPDHATEPDANAIIRGCDMARIRLKPSIVSTLLHRVLATGPIVRRRQENFRALSAALSGVVGARGLVNDLPEHTAPYVFPLYVDGAQRVDQLYERLRLERLPVFRWDRIWPGTPRLEGDTGPLWSKHVLQLLCHQDLSPQDIQHLATRVRLALTETRCAWRTT